MSDLTEAITANIENRAAPLVTRMSAEELNPKGGQANAGFGIAAVSVARREITEESCRRDRC